MGGARHLWAENAELNAAIKEILKVTTPVIINESYAPGAFSPRLTTQSHTANLQQYTHSAINYMYKLTDSKYIARAGSHAWSCDSWLSWA